MSPLKPISIGFSRILLLTFCIAAQTWAGDEPRQARAVLKAMDRAVLSAELAAKVVKLPLRTGERFKKGDLLVGLDCDLYRAQAQKVAAEHKAAGLKLENVRQLDSLGSIGALDVSLAQATRAQTAAELRIARLNTARCQIRAPYDGRVVTLLVNRFENVRQQQELIEIVNDSRLEAEVVVPSSWLAWLKTGQPISLQMDDTGTRIPAAVANFSPAIDTVSQTLVVRAQLHGDGSLVPGMSATAEFSPAFSEGSVTAALPSGTTHSEELSK
jgi:membrane fusion protein, multidrug efflux system